MSEFVTFEIAKKLKEKGFILDYNLYGYKPVYSDVNTIKLIWNIGAYEKDYFGENIPCPVISQVLKWLRDKFFLHISQKPYPCEDGLMWMYEIRKFNKYTVFGIANKTGFVEEEAAALAGIEYVLDNLI